MTQSENICDGKFISLFAKATKVTLETQVGFKTEFLKPYVKPANVKMPGVDIAGLINLSSPFFTGVIAICFGTETFLKIYEKMLGERHSEINHDVRDAAAELANIIFGQAKLPISKEFDVSLGMVIPVVITGKDIEVVFKSQLPTIILPFNTLGGPFHLEIIVDLSASSLGKTAS